MASAQLLDICSVLNDDEALSSSTHQNHDHTSTHTHDRDLKPNSGISTPSQTSSITPRLSSSSYAPFALKDKESAPHLQKLKEDDGLITLRYEEAAFARPPIPVTVAPPRKPPTDLHPALRVRREDREEAKRDSGLASGGSLGGNTISAEGDGEEAEGKEGGKLAEGQEGKEEEYRGELKIDFDSLEQEVNELSGEGGEEPQTPVREESEVLREDPTSPASVVSRASSMRQWIRSRSSKKESEEISTPKRKSEDIKRSKRMDQEPINEGREDGAEAEQERFSPLNTPIPSAGFMEEEFLDTMSFSKRGSIMFGGKKAVNGHLRFGGGRRQPSVSMLATPTPLAKILSEDVEIESQKVRSMYEQESPQWEDGKNASMAQRVQPGEASNDPFV